MKYVNQISVFVTNKTGSLAEVTKLLADAEIGLRAFSIADTSEFGILRMIVDQTEKAVDVLKAAHVTVLKTPVLAVRLEDKPGAMNRVMTVLSVNDISVEYAYAFTSHLQGSACVILRVEQPGSVASVLEENGLEVLGNEELEKLYD